MEWREGAKWIGILVAAGLISTTIEMVLQWKVFGPAASMAAREEARAEVDRLITAAMQKAQAKAPPAPKYTPPQVESSSVIQI